MLCDHIDRYLITPEFHLAPNTGAGQLAEVNTSMPIDTRPTSATVAIDLNRCSRTGMAGMPIGVA